MIVVICAANVFGKPKTNTDFIPYNGDGFKISIPSKWNPSKEVEYPGQVLRYEDNSDSTTNLTVTVTPTDKKSIKDYGSPEEFLSKVNSLTTLFLSFQTTGILFSFLLVESSENGYISGGLFARKNCFLW